MPKQILGQMFYGRDHDGYGVLGVSPTARPFIGAVAALCRAVGSPDRPGDVRPFLLSKREGDSILMIRACRGAADPTGRATIFFHALIADRVSLHTAGLDAFVLADAGLFVESCVSRELADLSFPSVRQQNVVPVGNKSIDIPATISSERPLDEFVRQELGANSLDRNWATFTFNPLSGFDICVLSTYSPRKGEGTQYVFDDVGLHRISPGTVRPKNSNEGASSTGRPFKKKSSSLLFLSLVANLVLVLALLLCGGNSDGDKPERPPSLIEMSESDAREKWEAKWKTEWKKSLPQTPPPMTEVEAKTKWASLWKSEWEKSLPPTPPPMTEVEAKKKWAAQWKLEWEKSLPSTPSAMTESEAKVKWEESWRKAWIQVLRKDFEKAIRDSGGEWPIRFDHANSPFQRVQSVKTEPDDKKLALKWRIYRSCKTCSDFIQKHLNPSTNHTP